MVFLLRLFRKRIENLKKKLQLFIWIDLLFIVFFSSKVIFWKQKNSSWNALRKCVLFDVETLVRWHYTSVCIFSWSSQNFTIYNFVWNLFAKIVCVCVCSTKWQTGQIHSKCWIWKQKKRRKLCIYMHIGYLYTNIYVHACMCVRHYNI